MVFLGLGANIGDRRQAIAAAVKLLGERPGITVRRVSSLYETSPVGYTDQPDFLNAVIAVDTDLEPLELLDVCLDIERRLGRVREKKWGPRTIDIDLLLYEGRQVNCSRLTIPHPFVHKRPFVLVPLAEIAPDLPVHAGKTAGELLAGFDETGVRLFEETPRGG